jgi:cell volume regulation protein A
VDDTHSIILLIGVLGIVSIVASVIANRFKAPLLLVFLCLGMLAGQDGFGGIAFNDFKLSYFLGSLALTVILFNGGLKTERAFISIAMWPSILLATLGVFITAAGIAGVARMLFHLTWAQALLIGAAVAPTDAAAVSTLLKRSPFRVPHRVGAILEMESGLNDPISVFLMIFAVSLVLQPAAMTVNHALILLAREMVGGAAIGIIGGSALLLMLNLLNVEPGIFPVLAFAGALAIFGGAQLLEMSGFMATYIAGFIVSGRMRRNPESVQQFFDAFGWIAQIGLFLLLGLLVTPHDLIKVVKPAMVVAVCLIFLFRPIAAYVCLRPFRLPLRDIGFIAWVGLRGAVPIFLTLIPVLAGLRRGYLLFGLVFVVVVTSLIVQGWTVGLAARWVKYERSESG